MQHSKLDQTPFYQKPVEIMDQLIKEVSSDVFFLSFSRLVTREHLYFHKLYLYELTLCVK